MMQIDWSRFLPALVLLLPPIALFHGPRVRYRALPQDWGSYWIPTLRLGLHSIDVLRAMLGAWCLLESFSAAPGASKFLPPTAAAVVMGCAMLLQTFFCREPHAVHAPFAFAAGLIIGYLPVASGGFSLVIAAVVAAGTRSPISFFPVLSLAVVVTGVLFNQLALSLGTAAAAAAVGLPWLIVLLFPRYWVATHARKRTTHSHGDQRDKRG